MPEVIEGSAPVTHIGREALSVVRDVVSRYLKLDINEVQRACEEERTQRLSLWKNMSTPTAPELNIPRQVAIDEATPPFRLYMPRKVIILIEEIKDYYIKLDGTSQRAPQTTAVDDGTKESTITTYTRWLLRSRDLDELWVVDPAAGHLLTALRLSTVHELAHASGDHPPRVPIPVNAVRGFISVMAIGRLLGEV